MKVQRHFLCVKSLLVVGLVLLSWSREAQAVGAGITYQGRLIDPSGNPVVSSSVQFKIQLRTPGIEDCLMYEEVQTKNLSETDGVFSLSIFDGSGARQDSSGYGLDQIFANKNGYTFANGQCATGTSWMPNATDGRRIQVSFNDGTFTAGTWEQAPAVPINFIPMAIEAIQVGGYKAKQLLKIADGVSTTGTELNSASWTELLALLSGTTTQYVKSGAANFTAAPQWNGIPSGANDLVNKTYVDAQVSAGLPNVGTAGTYAKVTTDTKGRVTSGGALVEADIPTLSTAGKVSGDSINAGTIGGSTAINSSGNLVTTGTVQGAIVRATNLRVFNGANYVQLAAPALGGNLNFSLPAADGGAGALMKTNGAGQLSFGTLGATDIPSLDTTKITTGTLPVGRGGTGQASYGSNSVVVSNLAGNGFSSLNCASGKVLKFDVSGFAVCGDDATGAGSQWTTTGSDIYFNTGKVGIGTTNPWQALTINGRIALFDSNGGNHEIIPNMSVNGSDKTLRFQNTATQSTEGFQFYNGNTSNSLMMIQQNGNVGIGTASPGSNIKLDVQTSAITGSGINVLSSGISGNGLNAVSSALTGSGIGVAGQSDTSGGGKGVYGYSSAATGPGVGVYGIVASNSATSAGVYGTAQAGYGVYGSSGSGIAGYFSGSGTNNTLPTLVTKQAGAATADLFQAQTATGTILANITSAGNFGIGTSNPGSPLVVSGNSATLPTLASTSMARFVATDSSSSRVGIETYGSGAISPLLRFVRANGTAASPSAILQNDYLGQVSAGGYTGGGYNHGSAGLVALARENWSASANGSFLWLFTTPNGSTTSVPRIVLQNDGSIGLGGTITDSWSFAGAAMVLDSSGRLGIGTTTPNSLLDVNGTLRVSQICDSAGSNCKTVSGGWSAAAGLSALTAATGTGTIDNTNYAQTWNWSTATTQSAMEMTANALTTGTLLNLTSSSATLNSTNGLLNVANTSAATTGTVARIQSNSSAGSGLTVLANGNVGIGTATPGAKLDVAGQIKTSTGLIGPWVGTETNTAFTLFANNGTNGSVDIDPATSRMSIINSDGTGTTTLIALRLINGNLVGSGSNGIGTSISMMTEDNTNQIAEAANIAAVMDDVTHASKDGSLRFSTLGPNAAAGTITASEKMRIDSAGNVGIGTASPAQKLDIVGNVSLANTSSILTMAASASSTLLQMSRQPGSSYYNNIKMQTGTTDDFFISSGGSNSDFFIGTSTGSSMFSIQKSTGNVGIGTAAPDAPLRITYSDVSNDLEGLRIQNSAGSSVNGVAIYSGGGARTISFGNNNATNETYIWNYSNSPIKIATNGTERLRVSEGGNVGIGVTGPTSKLQVAGDITPDTTATKNLGSSSLRWSNIYLSNAPDVSSDARLKKDVKTSDLGLDFVNSLRPVSWTWKDPNQGTIQHYGVIAQETESAIAKVKGQDSSNVIVTHNEETDSYSVRYTELISPLIKAIQELYNNFLDVKAVNDTQARQIASKADQEALDAANAKVQKLEAENAAMKARLDKIEKILK